MTSSKSGYHMASSRLQGGGASLAPTPTHPHQLSREHSKEDIETAESLSSLNHAHSQDRRSAFTPMNPPSSSSAPPPAQSRADAALPERPASAKPDRDHVGEYHSLDDTVQYQRQREEEEEEERRQRQSESRQATSTSPQRLGPPQPNTAPISGQICRYEFFFFSTSVHVDTQEREHGHGFTYPHALPIHPRGEP